MSYWATGSKEAGQGNVHTSAPITVSGCKRVHTHAGVMFVNCYYFHTYQPTLLIAEDDLKHLVKMLTNYTLIMILTSKISGIASP